jgi:hypothetical protein
MKIISQTYTPLNLIEKKPGHYDFTSFISGCNHHHHHHHHHHPERRGPYGSLLLQFFVFIYTCVYMYALLSGGRIYNFK